MKKVQQKESPVASGQSEFTISGFNEWIAKNTMTKALSDGRDAHTPLVLPGMYVCMYIYI